MGDGDQLMEYLRGLVGITSGRQHEYYQWLLDGATKASIASLRSDHGLAAAVTRITRGWKPKVKACYDNAWRVVNAMPNEFDYVEGQMSFHGVPIDHAWNRHRPTGIHVDITSELALRNDVTGREYLVLAVYDADAVWRYAGKTGHSGGFLVEAFKEKKH